MDDGKNAYLTRHISAPDAFIEVISHFYVAENHTGEPIHKTLVPSFQTILVCSFGAPLVLTTSLHRTLRIDKISILGPVKQAFEYTLPPGAEMLVANFRSDGFFRFFGKALQGLRPSDPDDLLRDNCFAQLWETLEPMTTMDERVSRILAFARPYVRPQDALITQIEQMRKENIRNSPVKEMAGRSGQTKRNIQLKHRQRLGYSVKELTRYERFLKALELVGRQISAGHKKVDWFDIIHDCGYYDQSQLIHDFRHYLGLSPTRYLKAQKDICQVRPS
jgi:AraC-like DNA-binding protein